MKVQCECTDPGCPACAGKCTRWATMVLVRIDMEDETGTAMCDKCAYDAFESGLFRESISQKIKAGIQ